MNLIADIPINNLSFGNVGVNILRELYARNSTVSLFPRGTTDLSTFNKLPEDFKSWIERSTNDRHKNLDKDLPTLTLWHLNGADRRISPKQFLLTFYELENPTFTEKKLVNFQDHTFLTNPSAVEAFKNVGCKNVSYVPLGFDPDFIEHQSDKKSVEGKTHFVLMGKYEKRKHTKEIVQTWLKKYGNNDKFLLTCCITNPFLKAEQMTSLLNQLLDGKHYSNINFLPHLKTNTEVNHLLNSADIDLTGLSGAEGWNLPAFNATGLGKWSVVYNHTGHRSWATPSNSILLEAKDKEDIYDDLFFRKGGPFNQGSMYKFDPDQVIGGMEEAVKKCGTPNEEGKKLQKDFTYKRTVDEILKVIGT
tara:strand:+ start:438 stop:1523 length:1086 start_codon:yes stop_codon:yes gene_type:complete